MLSGSRKTEEPEVRRDDRKSGMSIEQPATQQLKWTKVRAPETINAFYAINEINEINAKSRSDRIFA